MPRFPNVTRISSGLGLQQVAHGLLARWEHLRRDDRGEGVISAAIAVLVMAAIGALMWVGMTQIWQETEANTRDKVAEIGQ